VVRRARHDVGLDICPHEPGEIGFFNVQEICARRLAALNSDAVV